MPRRFAALMSLALTCAVAPAVQASALTGATHSVAVRPDRVVVRGGTVCAFLDTGAVSRRFQWKSGTMTGTNRFRSFSSVVQAMEKRGIRKGAAYRDARDTARSGDRTCGRLTSLRFRTGGFVALGIRSRTVAKSKGVGTTAVRTNAIGNLFGIRLDGSTSPVITTVAPGDTDAAGGVTIQRVYQAPDGSIYTLYQGHPEGCKLGRVEIGSQVETCVLSHSDLPEGISFGNLPVYLNEVTEPVKFDGAGHAYVAVEGVRKDGKCAFEKNAYMVHLIEISTDGSQRWLYSDLCFGSVGSWETLPGGGVIYWSRGASSFDEYFRLECFYNCSWLRVWKDGEVRELQSHVVLAPNGMRAMADGRVLISLWGHRPPVFPGSEFGGQGGMLMYDEQTGTLVPWYHYRSSNPRFAVEDVADSACACKSQIGIMTPLVRSSDQLYGMSMLFNGTNTSTAAASKNYLWRVYPTVEPLVPLDFAGMPNLAAVMGDSVLVSTGEYMGCTITSKHFNYPDFCRYSLVRADLQSKTATTIIPESDRIAVLTMTTGNSGQSVNIQAIRLSDKRYLTGTVDKDTTSVSWTVSPTIQFDYLTSLERLNS